MPAVPKHRRGGVSAKASPTVASLRAALASRCVPAASSTPWGLAASAAGLSGADAFLCHLSRSIATALERLAASTEATRSQLLSARAELHFAVDARCDELEARANAAKASKVVALERELCAVDAALERWRSEHGLAAEAASSLGDAELAGKHAELTTRLDAAEAQMLTLPTACIEPPCVELVVDAPAMLANIAAFGRVVAPRAVTAADLTLDSVPKCSPPGGAVRLRLGLRATTHASQSKDEVGISLGAAAAATHCDAFLEAPGAAPLRLQVDVSVNILDRSIVVEVAVPLSSLIGSAVRIGPGVVSGQPVGGMEAPLHVPVQRGIQVPLVIKCSCLAFSVCISPAGQLVAPQALDVLVSDSCGSRLPGIPIARLGLGGALWAAYDDGPSPTLLLGDDSPYAANLVAFNPITHAVRWSKGPDELPGCRGIVVFHDRGVVIASTHDETLMAYRLTDGANVGSLSAPGLSRFLTGDPTTGTIYAPFELDGGAGGLGIGCFSWTRSLGLIQTGFVAAAGGKVCRGSRPLTVVPPAHGKRVAHLVVGATGFFELLVIALPGLALVHTHTLKAMRVESLGADPCGTALAVSDSMSSTIHILAWPLPGMPELE